jgi:organic hydroperoxide reductase OsmC/OhrA
MAGREHRYTLKVTWTGNTGRGTAGYRAYERSHEIASTGKPVIPGSSDPGFRGDRSRWNPEELLLASLSACHQLWYLHLCAEAGVTVTAYEDEPEGRMIEDSDGGGRFSEVILRPRVTISAGSDRQAAEALHERAHELCFIANSVRCPVRCEAQLLAIGDEPTPDR